MKGKARDPSPNLPLHTSQATRREKPCPCSWTQRAVTHCRRARRQGRIPALSFSPQSRAQPLQPRPPPPPPSPPPPLPRGSLPGTGIRGSGKIGGAILRREGRDQPRLPAPHAGLPTSATRTTAQCFRRPRRPPAGARRDAPLPSPPPPLRRAPPPRLRLLTWPGRGGRARGRGSRGSRGSRAAAVQRRPSVRRGWRVSRGRVGGGGGRGEAAAQRGAGEGWGRGAGAQPCLTQPAADFRRRCRRLCPDQNTHTHTHTHTDARTSAAATSRSARGMRFRFARASRDSLSFPTSSSFCFLFPPPPTPGGKRGRYQGNTGGA